MNRISPFKPFSAADDELAARHRPILMFDANEPFFPDAFGYTVFRGAGASPSTSFEIVPKGAVVIEYAIWYDWDIGHLYELEHVWVHLDEDGVVIGVDASQHGRREVMAIDGGLPEIRDGRPVLYPEPGKHAHWADPAQISPDLRQRLNAACGPLSGNMGVLTGNPFVERGAYAARPRDHRLARLKLRHDAFVPAWTFSQEGPEPELVPWSVLEERIPVRVKTIMAELESTLPHVKAVFLDCGDTLVDESTEVKRAGSEVVLSGNLIPGAAEMVRTLRDAGHKLVLVADGPRESFTNLLGTHGLWDSFDAHIISGDVGETKPSPMMFDAALTAIGLTRADARHVVMVGNNLERDIRGANALGITSVFMAWSTQRSHIADARDDHPDYMITTPRELPALVENIERTMRHRVPMFIGD